MPTTLPFRKPGVTYNGLHSTVTPTRDQVDADFALARQHFEHARTYYPQYNGGVVDVGKAAKGANLNLLLGLYLFEQHDDWIADNYRNFVKPAVERGNIEGILVGNEDPQMVDNGIIAKYLQQAKSDFSQRRITIPVGTSQQSNFWLADSRAQQLLPLVDFIGVNIYPAWNWQQADGNNQPVGVTAETGFKSFRDTYGQIRLKYPTHQIVVTETGWPTTYGLAGSQQFQIGIDNAHEYLQRVIGWAEAQQVVLYIHNMFDDQYGIDESSKFNYHFGLIDSAGKSKKVLF